jgi:hypothetical protein
VLRGGETIDAIARRIEEAITGGDARTQEARAA